MYSTILIFALAGFIHTNEIARTPAWHSDYGVATKQVLEAKKPLAVFVGTGADGLLHMVGEAGLSADAKRILAAEYVCLYIDSGTEEGRRQAAQFEVTSPTALVISDRTGGVQAFRHTGQLNNDLLVQYLQRYSDPQHSVRTTESDQQPATPAPAANPPCRT